MLFNVARKTESIHPVTALINIFRCNKIATLENAPVATANHTSWLHSGLGNMDCKRAEGDEGTQINRDRTRPILNTNFGVGSAAIDIITSGDAAQV